MLRFLIILTISIGWLNIAHSQSDKLTGETNFIAAPEPGTLLVSSVGYGKSKNAALENAEINAFENLIFRGIPGSQHHLPMLPDAAATRKKHAAYFQNLLEKQGYKTFLMQSEIHQKLGKRNGSRNLTARIKINVDALRRDFEAKQVVRKFGL